MATHEPETRVRLTIGRKDRGRALTSEEFADADYEEPWKYERARGRLIVMPPDGGGHVETTSPWLKRLVVYWDQHPEAVHQVVPSAWVRVDGGTDRIGDIGVYLAQGPPRPEVPDCVPELIFEIVSPGRVSRDRDYREKRADYHRLGVREYVIVDRFKRQVTVLTHAPEGYEERVLTPPGVYESALLPGLAVPLAEVLPS